MGVGVKWGRVRGPSQGRVLTYKARLVGLRRRCRSDRFELERKEELFLGKA